MKLVMVGGGGFRTPLIYRALLRRAGAPLIDEITLHDTDQARLDVIEAVLDQMGAQHPNRPSISSTTHLDQALEGADFVFTAVRVGGLAGRVVDERVALDLGVLGQETTGPGGIAFGLRTVPVMLDIAERVQRCAPNAFVINFTNPAGMITEAMRTVLGDRVIGICDSPMGLAKRARRALGLSPQLSGDYAGLNHLGWLHSVVDDRGVDRLPELLARPDLLATIEEGQIFGADWLAELGAIPNEYLYYFYFTRDAIAATTSRTRGEFLLAQQGDFFENVDRSCACDDWNRVRLERNATYMDSARSDQRDEDDIDGGGYEDVAVAVMNAIALDEPTELILNTANRGAIAGLPADAVVEVPCHVSATGAKVLGVEHGLSGHEIGLVQQIKQVEQLTIRAAREGSQRAAIAAFALHPLVDSVTVAGELFDQYCLRLPSLAEVFDPTASPVS